MSMTPESRAAALSPVAFGEALTPEQAAFRDRIAQAIRDAENAAYDKVSEFCLALEAHLDKSGDPMAASVSGAMSQFAESVLTLKHKDT